MTKITNEDIIWLAEFVGHECSCSSDLDISCKVHDLGDILGCPDPFTDANDCEALIRALNERGYAVEMEIYTTGKACVSLWNDEPVNNLRGAYDDYKQGVCELALKVIDDD